MNEAQIRREDVFEAEVESLDKRRRFHEAEGGYVVAWERRTGEGWTEVDRKFYHPRLDGADAAAIRERLLRESGTSSFGPDE